MTDDNRFRAPRAHGFPQAQTAGTRVRRTEDPLAELARLIGQEDPFADFVPHRPADGRPGTQRRPLARDSRGHDLRGSDRRRATPASRSPDALDHDEFSDGEETHDSRSVYSYGRAPRAPEIPATPSRVAREERGAAARPGARMRPDPYPDSDLHDGDLGMEQPRSPRDARLVRRAPGSADDDGYGEYASEDYDPEYDEDAYLPAHGDEFYEEAPRRRLRGWMLVGTAAVAAIVVGTSGLFAYRALFGPETNSAPAKIISPEAGPMKTVPGGAQAADKRSQDRIGDQGQRSAERIVPREESPIDQSRIPQPGASDRIPQGTSDRIPGGTVTAAAPQFSPAPSQATAAPAPAAPPNLSTEPRRVRTVTVRSDGSVVPNAQNGTTRTTQTMSAPLALQGGGPSAVPPPRPATTSSSAPLQGDNPWSSVSSSGQVGPQAALPPAAPGAPAPTPAIAVNSPPPAGSYVVQVAAQKSESEAQATWQTLQQRYPSVLAGQQASIRRVDLGERGVFYRAQVGPFPSRTQASEVCQSLKAAGGECVIQRN